MLYERKEIPELHYMKHIHDDIDTKYIKYDGSILKKTLTPYIFQNNIMNEWLNRMEPLVSLMFDQTNVIKNWKNYMVDKYDYKRR